MCDTSSSIATSTIVSVGINIIARHLCTFIDLLIAESAFLYLFIIVGIVGNLFAMSVLCSTMGMLCSTWSILCGAVDFQDFSFLLSLTL